MAVMTSILAQIGGCGTCVGAEPPPPFLPDYTAEVAVAKLRNGPCGRALGDASITDPELSGYQDPGGPSVILVFEITTSAPSSLGVRYSTGLSVRLHPVTGEVLDPVDCKRSLRELFQDLTRTVAAAESTAEVQAFTRAHAPASSIQANFEPGVGTRGQIVYIGPRKGEDRDFLVWE